MPTLYTHQYSDARKTWMLLTILSVIVIGFFISASIVRAQVTDSGIESIQSFDVALDVHTDSSISVVENIVYDFGPYERHGIYRFIPLDAIRGSQRGLIISNFSVVDEQGQAHPFEVTDTHPFSVRIGDPDVTIRGVHTYVLQYDVSNAIGSFEEFDEIYWNTTGNQWEVPILSASATIRLPENVPTANLRSASYCGFLGSSDHCDLMDSEVSVDSDRTIVAIFPRNTFHPGQGMTVAVGFSKNVVLVPDLAWWEKAEVYQKIIIGVLGASLLFFLITFFAWFMPKWYKLKKSVTPQYEPPAGLTPSQAACILGDTSFQTAIAGEITYLASQGYLHIKDTSQDKEKSTDFFSRFRYFFKNAGLLIMLGASLAGFIYIVSTSGFVPALFFFAFLVAPLLGVATWIYFTDKRDGENNLHRGSTSNFSFIRTAKDTSTLSREHLQLLETITSAVDEAVSAKHLQESKKYLTFTALYEALLEGVSEIRPTRLTAMTIKSIWGSIVGALWMGVFLTVFFSLLFFGFGKDWVQLQLGLAEHVTIWLMASIIIIVVSGVCNLWFVFLWKRTLRVTQKFDSGIWYHVTGFKLYLETAEKDRIAFHDNPLQSTKIFSQWLPYALAFGIEDKWVKAFDGILTVAPDWYETNTSQFSAGSFTQSLSAFSYTTASVATSGIPKSSSSSGGSGGGGSSGGGGGGGGGGSW